jgi:hypothetical protein
MVSRRSWRPSRSRSGWATDHANSTYGCSGPTRPAGIARRRLWSMNRAVGRGLEHAEVGHPEDEGEVEQAVAVVVVDAGAHRRDGGPREAEPLRDLLPGGRGGREVGGDPARRLAGGVRAAQVQAGVRIGQVARVALGDDELAAAGPRHRDDRRHLDAAGGLLDPLGPPAVHAGAGAGERHEAGGARRVAGEQIEPAVAVDVHRVDRGLDVEHRQLGRDASGGPGLERAIAAAVAEEGLAVGAEEVDEPVAVEVEGAVGDVAVGAGVAGLLVGAAGQGAGGEVVVVDADMRRDAGPDEARGADDDLDRRVGVELGEHAGGLLRAAERGGVAVLDGEGVGPEPWRGEVDEAGPPVGGRLRGADGRRVGVVHRGVDGLRVDRVVRRRGRWVTARQRCEDQARCAGHPVAPALA